ncbi:hypothetical protein EBT11_04280 [bacterium]|nr:hypothetical protein [bacterium]
MMIRCCTSSRETEKSLGVLGEMPSESLLPKTHWIEFTMKSTSKGEIFWLAKAEAEPTTTARKAGLSFALSPGTLPSTTAATANGPFRSSPSTKSLFFPTGNGQGLAQ